MFIIKLYEEIAHEIATAANLETEFVLQSIEIGKQGEITSKIAFVIAKERKENPALIAKSIIDKLPKNKYFAKIEAIGPYLNFYLSDLAYQEALSNINAKKGDYSRKEKDLSGKTMIEYPSVNPNKPWHIGHLRNAILGEAVARILEFNGENVERIDYIDDLGLQVAQSLWGYLKTKKEGAKINTKFDTYLGTEYVKIASQLETNQKLAHEIKEIVKHLEEGNNIIATEGRNLAELCVRSQYQTAFDYLVYHDALIFESDIMRTIFHSGLKMIIGNNAVVLEKTGKNAGCYVVKLSEEFEKEFGKMENPDKVLIRSDGTAVYTGKDVIFHLWKFGKLQDFLYDEFIEQPNGKKAYKSSKNGKIMHFGKATKCINVIGVEQKYPQKVIVEVLKRLNYEKEAKNLHHLSYEHVVLADENSSESKLSGRKGTWVGFTADDLLKEAKERVLNKISIEVSETERNEIAHMVGVGAIKFSFLKTSADKKIMFKWDEALSMEGNSGPYAQYSYVRTLSILEKAQSSSENINEKTSLNGHGFTFNESEKKLIKVLLSFSFIIERSAKELAPHHLAIYILEVAKEFASFYDQCPVLNAEPETRNKRLRIVAATNNVLGIGLNLLGINCPKRM